MKKKINFQRTHLSCGRRRQYAIPDGEGFNALPIAFVCPTPPLPN